MNNNEENKIVTEPVVQPAVEPVPVQPTVEPTPVQPTVEPTPVQPAVEPTPVQPTVEPVPVQPTVEPVPQQPIEPTPVPQPETTTKSKKGKYILTVIFFLLLFILIFFLPEITTYIDKLTGNEYVVPEIRDDPNLNYNSCQLEINNDKEVYNYEYKIYQDDTNSQITKITVVTNTSSDSEEFINETDRLCLVYQDTVKESYDVSCEKTDNSYTMIEYFNYKNEEQINIEAEISEMNATILNYTSSTRSEQVLADLHDAGFACREIFE